MHRLIWIPLFALGLLVGRSAQAATYYVSSSGDDAHDGSSSTSPWKTISKVNAASLQPGDSVLFERGDTFYGTITPAVSGTAGQPITYGAYGSGAKPLISGFTTITAWTNVGGNVWEAPVAKSGARPRSVVINGVLQPVGRYPKVTASNGGYLTVVSHTTNTSATDSLTDPELAGAPDFVGAELILRTVHWAYDSTTIATQVGTTLTFPDTKSLANYPLVDGFGYFIQNSPATLTANGDWYYGAADQKLGLYSTTRPSSVKVSTLEQLVSIQGRSFLDFTDLAFEGSNAESFYDLGPSSSVNVEDCSFKLAGTYAIYMYDISNALIDGNTITGSLNDGIDVTGSQSGAVTITNNVISDTGTRLGMVTGLNQSLSEAVQVGVGSGATIEKNTITNTGYIPIAFSGNDISIKNNVLDRYCTVLDDGGGIYTWNGRAKTFSNRAIAGNVMSNGIGAPQGTRATTGSANGIYLDDNTNHVEVTGNTAYQMAGLGLHSGSPAWVTIKDNTFFDNKRAWDIVRWVIEGRGGYQIQEISNLDVTGNLFVSRTASETSYRYYDTGVNQPAPSTSQARLAAMGTIDHNYYYSPNAVPVVYMYCPTNTTPYRQCTRPPAMSLSQWTTVSGFESSSVRIPPYPAYTLNSLVGVNLYPNGTFETGIAGVWASSTNDVVSWDQTGKLSGTGSLKVAISAAPATPNDVVYVKGAVGPVSSSKKYILRVSTLGTTDGGILGASFDEGAKWLAPEQFQPYGTGRVDHEFLIDAPTDSATASWVLTVLQTGGTTYIDNVAVYEADATATSPDDYVQLKVNRTDTGETVPLDKTYVDYQGTPYCGSLTLAPYSSVVLFASTVACTPPPAADAGVGDGASGDGGSTVPNDAGSSGCNCTAAGSQGEAPWLLLLGCVGLALGRLRRRRE